MQPLVNVATNSLTPLGEQIKLTAAVPFRSGDVKYVMGEIRVPIGSDGLAVKVDGYHYDARPKDDAIEYLGFQRRVRNDRIGLGVSYPFLLNNTRSLTGTLGYTRPIPRTATKPTTAIAGCNRTRACAPSMPSSGISSCRRAWPPT